MHCEILTSEPAITAIAGEWQSLHSRAGCGIFSGYAWFDTWWRHLGQAGGFRPHVVIGRRDGRLVAIAPLAVMRRKGVRLLQWAGSEIADYSDFLLEKPEDASALWQAV